MSTAHRRPVRTTLVLALAAFAALALAVAVSGCSSSSDAVKSAVDDSSATTEEAQTSSARTLDQIKESGTINIGVFTDKAPFGYVDDSGTYQGYDVEFANRLASDLGVSVNFVATDAANRVPYLESNKVDIILANFTVTDERAEKVDFAKPYMKVSLGIVSPDSSPITDVSQLSGKTLIVTKGTTAETYFEANYPDINLQKYDQYADSYNALMDGRGDAFSTDNTEVLAWAKSNPGYTVGVDSLGDTDTIAPAVHKGNTTVLDYVNDEIVKLGDEDFFHQDYAKTLEPVYGDEVDPDQIVVEGGQL
ncbi:MAG: cysteine ABC transporter substrate-binding protein [Atopobiaceae bacterium]|jgi:polar amino acid transport system substrate-binding protein|nr:cysteine ABC transporter substrate-binding protein [Atopobiaceae bacterium]MCI2173338.1 cysteine ABC transporter substrate-binding protein [Atopobiaceae bacterium]MCI2207333.1 cysteine ABC transporter substrate-binding protein [Atopobiaceae bacterium]